MRSSVHFGLGILVSGVVMALSASAMAQPRTANVAQVGAGFRYGADLEDGDLNPWGPGLGIEIGYTFDSALYLGGNFEYFFGETVSAFGAEASVNIWQLAGVLGYDLQAGDAVVIRPKLNVGMASLMAETCVTGFGCADDSETDFAMAPGATFMFFPGSVVLSLDMRYQLIFSDPETLDGIIFSFGIGF